MPQDNKKKTSFKDWLIALRSPIRWGFLGLSVAIILFLIELSLSCYDIYLSLVGGGVVVGIDSLAEIFIVVAMIFAVLSSVAFIVTVIVVVIWRRNRNVDDTLNRIKSIQDNLIGVKQDTNKIKDKLAITDVGEKDG